METNWCAERGGGLHKFLVQHVSVIRNIDFCLFQPPHVTGISDLNFN